MSEQPSRKRRIVKRFVLIVAIPVLLLSGYVGSWLSVWWLFGRGWITSETFLQANNTVFAPAQVWMDADLPPGKKRTVSCLRWAAQLGKNAKSRESDRPMNDAE